MKRWMAYLLLLALLLGCAGAEGEKRVFLEGETEPFPEGAELLTLRVAPVLGGDCMLLTLGEHSMFVDVGHDTDIGLIHDLLSAAGLDHVDAIFNSHPHSDHAGGVRPLLAEGFPIGVYYNFFPHDFTESYQIVIQKPTIQALEAAGVPIVDLQTEAVIPFGDALLTALRVPDDRVTHSMTCNNLSAMLRIQYGECTALLSADVENLVQPILAEVYDLKADILKYPHHGVVAVHKSFLDAVDPEYVVFTHGTKNTLDAQKHLVRNGYTRMTFATWGMITLQTDGHKWIVRQDILPSMEKYVRNYQVEK